MEVILLADVEKVGLRGDVVSVARGYARNYLVPRRLAEEATPARVAELRKRDAQRARHEAKTSDEAQAVARKLGSVELRFDVKASPTGSGRSTRCASTGGRSAPTRSSGSAATRCRSTSSRA